MRNSDADQYLTDQGGGNIRRTALTVGLTLLVAVTLATAVELWLRAAETAPASEPAGGQGAPLVDQEGLPSMWEPFAIGIAAARLALPTVLALTAIPLLTAGLLHKLYDTRTMKDAHETLNRLVFGRLGGYPFIVAKEGQVTRAKDRFARDVGGPATLVVYNDTAVVTEQYGALKRILGAGKHYLERFEKVWETIDLRPQRWVYEVFALTKEGIPISCQADISFRIAGPAWHPDQEQDKKRPYPFSEEAVLLAATAKWVRKQEDGDVHMPWTDRLLIGFTEGPLRNILAEYRLDWLTAPPQPGQQPPRDEIRQRLESELEQSVGKVGARLLKVELGRIEVKARDEEVSAQLDEIVSRQRIEAWHAEWQRRALVSKAEGEAELLRMDMARIQAQADMVVTLTEALQSTLTRQGAIEPYILALRFVEALRWMSYNTISRDFMPPEAMLTLNRLQEVLQPKTAAGDKRKGEPPPPQEAP